MPRVAYKMPIVFVACPYDEKHFRYSHFKRELETLPFTVQYANTTLETKHLLDKIRRLINSSDFSFFDLSMWNPNVALELGLADGQRAKYYILVNARLDKDVPSDIKGIQRIQYSQLSGKSDALREQVIQYFFKSKYPLTRDLWNRLSRKHNSAKLYDFGLRILAFLRDHDALDENDIRSVARGLRLRQPDFEFVTSALIDLNAIYKSRRRTEFQLKRSIYKR